MSGSAPHSTGEAGTGARGTGVRTFAVTGILSAVWSVWNVKTAVPGRD